MLAKAGWRVLSRDAAVTESPAAKKQQAIPRIDDAAS
jgi:hypothetical protein